MEGFPMKTTLLACLFAIAMAGAAMAQSGTPAPQVRLPTPSQATLRPTPRHLELLRGAGIDAAAGSIRTPTTLSVRNPIAGNASLGFVVLVNLFPAADTQGVAQLEPNSERGDQSWVEIRFRADATSRYIVDCAVSGDRSTNFRFVRYSGEGASRRRETSTVTIADGRAGMVLQPRGIAGEHLLYLEGVGGHAWQFRSCEITPVG
jgi:hypothetical protein